MIIIIYTCYLLTYPLSSRMRIVLLDIGGRQRTIRRAVRSIVGHDVNLVLISPPMLKHALGLTTPRPTPTIHAASSSASRHVGRCKQLAQGRRTHDRPRGRALHRRPTAAPQFRPTLFLLHRICVDKRNIRSFVRSHFAANGRRVSSPPCRLC